MTFNKTCELKATNLNIKSLTKQQVLTQTSIKIQFTWSAKWNPPYFCHRPELFWSDTRRTTPSLSQLSCHKVLAMLPFFFSWPDHCLGIEAPFGSFSTSLSFRTMIWSYWVYIDVSLKGGKAFSFPSHHLRSQTPPTFQLILPGLTWWERLSLAWTHSKVRRTLSCLNSL